MSRFEAEKIVLSYCGFRLTIENCCNRISRRIAERMDHANRPTRTNAMSHQPDATRRWSARRNYSASGARSGSSSTACAIACGSRGGGS